LRKGLRQGPEGARKGGGGNFSRPKKAATTKQGKTSWVGEAVFSEGCLGSTRRRKKKKKKCDRRKNNGGEGKKGKKRAGAESREGKKTDRMPTRKGGEPNCMLV